MSDLHSLIHVKTFMDHKKIQVDIPVDQVRRQVVNCSQARPTKWQC
jgi:hypothetical protein